MEETRKISQYPTEGKAPRQLSKEEANQFAKATFMYLYLENQWVMTVFLVTATPSITCTEMP